MAAPMNVELGFVENAEKFLLRCRFFPSKLGGRPAWLSLENLPSTDDLTCPKCSKPTSFLLQVYSPNTKKSDTFHRTIFIFVCSNPECCKPNDTISFHVFRSQLPRENKFYNVEPPVEEPVQEEVDASCYNKLCTVCGCLGSKACSRCHKVNYCSKEHQIVDWKAGHKSSCSEDTESVTSRDVKYSCLFPEMELVTETENTTPDNDTEEKSEEVKLKEYSEYVKSSKTKAGTLGEVSEAELQKMSGEETKNDKQLRRFKKRISHEPDQVLRYERGGEPLWISDTPKPDYIPDCKCGAKRQFEFQVLPHLLSYMNVDKVGASLDWGILCIYTCSEDCTIDNTYSREYLFKQDIS